MLCVGLGLKRGVNLGELSEGLAAVPCVINTKLEATLDDVDEGFRA